jgi:hypothetical protein
MLLQGSGTSTSYLTVSAYGSGAMPIINGRNSLSFFGLYMYNTSYVQVENLSFENSGTGILINSGANTTGYRFLDLYFSGDGVGIESPAASSGIASNILVQDVEGVSNTLSCTSTTYPCDGSTLSLGGVSNVIVNRLYSSNNCTETGWGLGPGASNVVVENSDSTDDASCPGVGTTANFIDDDTNVTFVNDAITDVPASVVDASAIDIEPQDGPDNGINIEDNYIANNAGPGIEILDHPSPIANLNISGNVLSNNGAGYGLTFVPYPLWGQIWTDEWLSNFVEATGSIENNLYNAPAATGGFEETHASANLNGFNQSNNMSVSGPGNVWYAANGFSCTAQGASGWSYQSSVDNSTWTNLSGCSTVDTLDQEWTTGGTASGFVSNFEELPPSTSTSWVARSWTAQNSGSVSIRGRILMTDPTCGSGVTAEITKNGSSTPIWGPQTIAAGDGVGVDTNLDGVSVNAGDVLHFAVQENGSGQCRVSWTPSVAIPNPVTTVVFPSGGTDMTGIQTLDSSASDSASPISEVQYVLTGGSLNDAVIATATPTNYGWLARWQSGNVANGTYTLQSVVTDAAGNVAYSPGVTINVDNSVTTNVLLPSSGSWVSGSQVALEAGASDVVGVTKVEFHLTGGSLHNALIATATPSSQGWSASWNSTTVPDGTYTLQSVAYDAAGNQGASTGVTLIVENTPPTSTVVAPSNGSWVSGNLFLGANAPTNVGVTKVEFHLTGGALNKALIATATSTTYGWLAGWSSTTVPDGTYTLQAEAYDGAGLQALSAGVTVVVENTPPTTSVMTPSSGASVSGSQVPLDAAASLNVGVNQVQFHLTGGALNYALIATATPTYFGWLASWNSTTVPDGTYTLQSEASDAAGNQGVSTGVTVVVDNPPPTTSVVIPSNGASVSGAQVTLDASASDKVGVTKVEFHLTGGSLNNALIATATLTYFGWLASWNSTTVPDGTYTLQSEASDAAGNQGVSPAISVTVAN